MLRFIHRDSSGKMLGHYANKQSYATEGVPEDHPDIVAWNEARDKLKRDAEERKARLDPEKLLARIEALEARLK